MKRLITSFVLGLISASFASLAVAQSFTTGAITGAVVNQSGTVMASVLQLGNVGCDALAFLTFVLGIAVGAVLTYIPFAFRIITLRRRIERLKSSLA